MAGPFPSTRTDLHLGAVFGLAAAALTWSAATSAAWLEPASLGFVVAGSLVGLVAARLPGLGRISGPRVLAFAALLLFGLGPAVLARALGATLQELGDAGRSGTPDWLGSLHRVSSATLETLLAASAFLALGGAGPLEGWGQMLLPVAGFVLLSAAAQRVFEGLRDLLRGAGKNTALSAWRAWREAIASGALVVALAVVVSLAFQSDTTRALLLIAPVAGVGGYLVRLTRGRSRQRRPPAPGALAVSRSIAHALGSSLSDGGAETAAHLERVHSLVLELGRRLGTETLQREATGVAALLHEIPGIEETGRVLFAAGTTQRPLRSRPGAGAGLLDAVRFPYSLRPILRHLQERWDGRGRPDGLAGESIPLGARILAVADCYDGLASDRPYRKGLPPQICLESLRHESGKAYDPRVVDALAEHVRAVGDTPRRSRHGDGRAEPAARLGESDRRLVSLYEIDRAVGYRLDRGENLVLVTRKLDELVPHDAAVVYLADGPRGDLVARHAFGRSAEHLLERTIEAGEGLSGRAAAERRTTHDRAPRSGAGATREWVAERGPEGDGALAWVGSAVAAPLVIDGNCLGTLAVYSTPERVFSVDERELVAAVAAHAARAIRHADPRHPGYLESLTDPLTGLPNARYLEITAADLTPELAECGRGFGLLAFRVRSFARLCEGRGIQAAERLLSVLARRLAAGCDSREVPVRYGHDLFLVLCPSPDPACLVRRWDALLRAAEEETIDVAPGRPWRPDLLSAHARCPDDGRDLPTILRVLHDRLAPALERDHRVVPFRVARTG